MLGKGQQLKTTALSVFFLWLVKLEKLINDIIVDHVEKCDPFSDFQYGFRSSWSTADLSLYLASFLLFSVIDGLESFWTGSLHKNIQLLLEFLKAPFMFQHFSYYTLMTFLTILFVILLSMLMILLSILSAIRQLLELASELESDLQDTGLGQDVACWFQCWENLTGCVWQV